MPIEPLHEVEPMRGLPELLPDDEDILWQGRPAWWSLARRAFHVGLVAAYFAGLLLYQFVAEPAAEVAGWTGFVAPVVLGVAAVGMLSLLAWLITVTTVFTITNRRVVMQFGVALPLNLNLPFTQISSVAHKSFGDGTGDLALGLEGDDRVAYALLWPYARPWRVRKPQPMLRSIPQSSRVAEVLAEALAQAEPAEQAPRDDSRGLNPAAVSG